MNRRRHRVLGVHANVLALMLIIATAMPAYANHQGNSTALMNRDNNTQDVEEYNLTNAGRVACRHGDAQLERSEIATQAGTTDIHCHDGSYVTDWIGQTYCQAANWNGTRCDHYNVTFNYYYNGGTNPDTTVENYLWMNAGCHEFGHTSSIGHISSVDDPILGSCMQSSASEHRRNFMSMATT